MAIPLRSPRDIDGLGRAGAACWSILDALVARCVPGVATWELDALAADLLAKSNAESLFLGYRGPAGPAFPGHICVSINEELVHGIPGDRLVRPGDVVSIDLGLRLGGWCADAARTVLVPPVPEAAATLHTGVRSILSEVIDAMRPGIAWSEIVRLAASGAQRAGIRLIEPYAGHGIGRTLHEKPRAPFLNAGFDGEPPELGEREDFVLRPGMVLAVEPIGVAGSEETLGLDDGWTVVARDRSIGCHEERTVAIVRGGRRVLTA